MKKIAVKVEMICGVFMSSASMILQAGIGIVIFVGTMLLVKGEIELLVLVVKIYEQWSQKVLCEKWLLYFKT